VKQIFFSALRKHGVKKGDRVVGYIPNCAEAIEAMAATAAIGAIWSSTSPDFGVSGVLDRFSQIQPKVRISSLPCFFSAFLASLISSHRYSLRFDSHLQFLYFHFKKI
jgi:acyl-CoA synthetase (AMP-forming)/AMP-acid ligase II